MYTFPEHCIRTQKLLSLKMHKIPEMIDWLSMV